MKPPFTAEAKRQALEAGIDLDDKQVQEHLMHVLEKKKRAESASPHLPHQQWCAASYWQYWQRDANTPIQPFWDL